MQPIQNVGSEDIGQLNGDANCEETNKTKTVHKFGLSSFYTSLERCVMREPLHFITRDDHDINDITDNG
jgi:hypothetical protein